MTTKRGGGMRLMERSGYHGQETGFSPRKDLWSHVFKRLIFFRWLLVCGLSMPRDGSVRRTNLVFVSKKKRKANIFPKLIFPYKTERSKAFGQNRKIKQLVVFSQGSWGGGRRRRGLDN